MAEEQVFLNEKNILVTTTRFVVKEKTYPLSSVDSVSKRIKSPDLTTPIVIGAIGIAAFWFAAKWWYALILIAIAAVWWVLLRKKYTVELLLHSEMQDVFTSYDKKLVERVIAALNEAIISRG